MEDPKPLELLNDVNVGEKIIGGIVSGLFCIADGIPHLWELISNGFKPNSRSWKPQAKKYVENNETIYVSIDRNSETMGFVKAGTIPNLLMKSVQMYSSTPCIGRRKIVKKVVERCPVFNKPLFRYEFGEYVWKPYHQVYTEISRIAKKLIDLDIGPDTKFALYCNTSPEWLMMVYALMLVSCPIVIFFPALSEESLIRAVNEAEVTWIMVDEKTLPRLISILKSAKTVKNVIISNYLESDPHNPPDTTETTTYIHFKDFVRYDSDTDFLGNQPTDTNSLALIMYTSGTVGDPKGVMISHKNLLTCLESVSTTKIMLRSSNNNEPHVYAAYLPSSHIFECLMEILMISLGNSIAFSTPFTLFDMSPMILKGSRGDIPMIRPSIMIVVPLILERMKKQIIDKLQAEYRLKQLIFQYAYNIKMKFRMLGYQTPIIDRLIFKPLRSFFGGNLKLGMIGGAYISREIEEFANICFGEFRQGYGMTEASSGICTVNYEYMRTGSCGGPISNIEIKLLNWDEGAYSPTDEPYPGGEIAICGDSVTLGYYKNPSLNKTVFTFDSNTGKRWFRTGDIGTILPDLTLKIIGRKGDMVKLSHGEHISLSKVEKAISECPLVEMVCVLPNETNVYLIALIVPQREKVKEFSSQISLGNESDDVENLLANDDVRKKLGQNIWLSVYKKLARNEVLEDIIIVQDVWSPDNNLVTPTMKIKRTEILKKYGSLLN